MVAGVESVVVVGAGSFGASLAWWLARDGVQVTLVDQFTPGDARATSGGETRLIRASHGADEDYTRMSRRALGLWRELEADSGEELVVDCGLAWFAHRAGGWEDASETVLRRLGIPCERLDPDAAARLFPSFSGDDLSHVLLEPEAGALRAARAVRALASCAASSGVRLVRSRASPEGETVRLDDGTRLEGDLVVWACGAWLPGLFGDLVHLRVTHQNLFFYDGGSAWRSAPAWVDYDAAMYGTPDIDALGVKLAPDSEGPEVSADDDLPEPDFAAEREGRAYMGRRFPALADAPRIGATSCRYELSPDSHFIAAPHPNHASVWLYGGGSGHGFKHGPALAERLVGALRGGTPLPARFALGERDPGSSLRTAGSS